MRVRRTVARSQAEDPGAATWRGSRDTLRRTWGGAGRPHRGRVRQGRHDRLGARADIRRRAPCLRRASPPRRREGGHHTGSPA
eukprot:2641777-Alexandrium_andersonii.AAC.1